MNKKVITFLLGVMTMLCLPIMVFAEGAAKVDTGDTAFVVMATVLVFIMTPGLALFYGGLVRKKNVLSTMMSSIIAIVVISLQWVIIGYTLAFGPDSYHLIGGLDWFGLNGVGAAPNADYAATIPHSAFVLFQLMFAIITPALIAGSIVERMKFSVYIVFILLWSTLIYDPLAHWVWGVGGWLRNLGALDFAGGNVVHISSGISALVAALVLGKRKGYKKTPMIPHNIPFVLIGMSILWFGWFGFNAGSALGMNGLALSAFLTTNTAAAAAGLSWMLVEWFHRGKPTILGIATGAVVGLVAITPAAGFVTVMSSIAIGLMVSPICYFAVTYLKHKLGYDDSLDAFGCHGVGGMFGAIATGVFASKAVNPAGNDGLIYGNIGLFGTQIISVVATVAFAAIGTFLILKIISIFTKLRVDEKSEEEGLDISQHGEEAYPDFSSEKEMAL